MGDAFLTMDLWKNYKEVLFETFPDMVRNYEWANWKGKDTNLVANLYTHPHFIKRRMRCRKMLVMKQTHLLESGGKQRHL